MILRVLGAEMRDSETIITSGWEDAFEAGRGQVLGWERQLVGSSTGLVMVDASGLSRRNLISASGLIKVLVHMNRSAQLKPFLQSLATPGVGTLQDRLLGLPTGVTVHAKTGSMGRIRSLSGYVSTIEGPRIAFSIICNNYLCSPGEIESAMENICYLLALYLKDT